MRRQALELLPFFFFFFGLVAQLIRLGVISSSVPGRDKLSDAHSVQGDSLQA